VGWGNSKEQQGADHDFPACHPAGNAGYLAYAISFSPARHYKVKHPKGVRDISCVLLVEEQSGLLRSTGKTGQKMIIAPVPFTVEKTIGLTSG
jgi:hypothetical protein